MNNGTQETATETKATFESEVCTRCGGSGNFSRCAMYGTRCFRCAGAGKTLTKRGAAAKAYRETLRTKRVDQLVAGDRLWNNGVPGYVAGGWDTVVEVVAYNNSKDRSWINGVEQPKRNDLLSIECVTAKGEKSTWGSRAPESVVRVAQTPERLAETHAEAIAYQATLTIKGVLRKRAA